MSRKPEDGGGGSGGVRRQPALQGRKPVPAGGGSIRTDSSQTTPSHDVLRGSAAVGKAPLSDKTRERLGSLANPLGPGSRATRPGIKLEAGADRTDNYLSAAATGTPLVTVKKERDEGVHPLNVKVEKDASGGDGMGAGSSTNRKVKFAPKVPARRLGKTRPASASAAEEDVDDTDMPAEFRDLLNQSQEALLDRGARRPMTDKKPGLGPVRVAFGFGSTIAGRAGGPHSAFHGGGSFGGFGSSTRGSFHGFDSKKHVAAAVGGRLASSARQGTSATGAAVHPASTGEGVDNDVNLMKIKKEEDYLDYTKYFPTTLPMRNPFEDEEEEEEPLEEGRERPFDEEAVPAADELELRTEGLDDRLFFIQLPVSLPLASVGTGEVKEKNLAQNRNGGEGNELTPSAAATTRVQQGKGAAPEQKSEMAQGKGKVKGAGLGGLAKLPPGKMGKLIIYESGAIQFRVGDVLMDVEAGSQCKFHQEVVAVDITDRKCYFFGDVSQRMNLCPNIDNLLGKASIS